MLFAKGLMAHLGKKTYLLLVTTAIVILNIKILLYVTRHHADTELSSTAYLTAEEVRCSEQMQN